VKSSKYPLAVLLLTCSLTLEAQPPTNDGAAPDDRNVAQALQQPDSGRPMLDIFALIERLADEMDKEFIVDPRISRSGVGWSTEGVDDTDYDSLLAVLRYAGFAAIEVGDQIRIMPEQFARAEPSRLLQQDDPRVSDHAVVTRVIDVGDIRLAVEGGPPVSAAPQLIPVLRPLMSMAVGSLVSVAGTNKIVLVDRYDNIRRITAIIEELRP
jgi:general secretion pathway protein D